MEPLSADDPRQIGEFTLRSRLGAGGMGRVYLAFSPGGRAVAIKVVHPGLAADPEFLRRFRHEVAAARAVGGMYTAPVVGAGIDDNPPWLATAYVPGPPLAEVVTRYGALAETAVWRLAGGLTEALRAVHACGLVHRDLKPGNVLLAADGPHVIDFGISRAFDGTSVTSTGMVVGTPGYMSPEQAEGQPAGPPSDVFSLGCVLAYAATGNAPFGGGSAASILYRVVTGTPDLGDITGDLRQVITACLVKNPAERIGLAQLGPMIAALGPAMRTALGAFWPEPLASIIAADHTHPVTQVSPPPAGPAPVGGPAFGGSPLGGSPLSQVPVSGSPYEPAPVGQVMSGVPGGQVSGGLAAGGPAAGGLAAGGLAAGGLAAGAPGSGAPVGAGSGGGALLSEAALNRAPVSEAPAGQLPMGAGPVGAGPLSQPPVSPGQAGSAGPASPAQSGWTSSLGGVRGTPPPGQAGAVQPGSPSNSLPPVAASGYTGHAPMVADGYYAAAANSAQAAPSPYAPPDYAQPPVAGSPPYGQPSVEQGPGWAPQHPAGQQPPSWQQSGPGAPTTPASRYPAQYPTPSWPPQTAQAQAQASAPGGASWPPQQPGPGGSWPGSGQPGGPGGPSYPSAGNPLAQYAPGAGPQWRPTKAEIPPPVLGSIRLMYVGAVVTLADLIFGAVAAARDNAYWDKHKNAIRLAVRIAAKHNQTMAGILDLTTVLGGAIGIVCWLVIARACRRGRPWTRIAPTVLLALDTAGMLTVLLATHDDVGTKTTSLLVAIIGLAATVPLWGKQARTFFATWRRH